MQSHLKAEPRIKSTAKRQAQKRRIVLWWDLAADRKALGPKGITDALAVGMVMAASLSAAGECCLSVEAIDESLGICQRRGARARKKLVRCGCFVLRKQRDEKGIVRGGSYWAGPRLLQSRVRWQALKQRGRTEPADSAPSVETDANHRTGRFAESGESAG